MRRLIQKLVSLVLMASVAMLPARAFALSGDEIADAVSAMDLDMDRQCAKDRNTGLTIATEAIDLNGDGIEEVIGTVELQKDLTYCHGMIGTSKFVAIRVGDEWRPAFYLPSGGFEYRKRDGSPWPDIVSTIWGYGDCSPVFRYESGTYVLHKQC